MPRTIIVFLGGPGAGKGTQAQALMRYLPIPQISTGDLLRAEARRETDLGQEISRDLSAGILVGDEIVNHLLAVRIRKEDCNKGFMLDGYPRTLNQAVALQSQLTPRDKFVVIEIEVDPERMIARMTSRLICPDCGYVYNTTNLKSRSQGICDVCNGQLKRRSDDQESIIRERFRAFAEQTLPLRGYFKQLGVYNNVSGMRPPEEVSLDILTVLDIEGIRLNSPVARRS
jgi:adenylate kinase